MKLLSRKELKNISGGNEEQQVCHYMYCDCHPGGGHMSFEKWEATYCSFAEMRVGMETNCIDPSEAGCSWDDNN